MSLLMDALKKAELSQQHSRAQVVPIPTRTKPCLELEPLASAPPGHQHSGDTASARPLGREVANTELLSEAGRTGSAKPAASRVPPPPLATDAGTVEAARQTARQVFAVKQPSSGERSPVVLAGILALVTVAGTGLYFWFQLQPAETSSGIPRGPVVAIASRPPAAPQPVLASSPSTSPIPAEPPDTAIPLRESRTPTEAQVSTQTPTNSGPLPIRVANTPSQPNLDLLQAFDALTKGNLDVALTGYARVLSSEPRNADALHGMAGIALRQGRDDLAEKYYRQAIEADPKDAIALAGLIGIWGHADPLAAESQLKTLIAAQPKQPLLHFALGNLHAAAGRWYEAQQAFFSAHSGDPEHPDYLFNLAISLDHLHQPKLAIHFYRQALSAASHRLAGFDKVQADARLQELLQ